MNRRPPPPRAVPPPQPVPSATFGGKAASTVRRSNGSSPPPIPPSQTSSSTPRTIWLISISAGAVVLGCALLLGLLVWNYRPFAKVPALRKEVDALLSGSLASQHSELAPTDDRQELPTALPEDRLPNAPMPDGSTVERLVTTSQEVTEPEADNSATEPEAETPPCFVDLRHRGYRLELPGRGVTRDATEVRLATVKTEEAAALELSLLPVHQSAFQISTESVAPTAARSWAVRKTVRTPLGDDETILIARFFHRDHDLCFAWNEQAANWSKPGSLQFLSLQFVTGPHRASCKLWKPIAVKPLTLVVGQRTSDLTVELPVAAELIDPPERFCVQYQWANVEATPPSPAKLGDEVTAVLKDGSGLSLEVRLKAQLRDSRCALEVSYWSTPPALNKKGEIVRDKREPLNAEIISKPTRRMVRDFREKNRIEIGKLQKELKLREAELNSATAAAQSNSGNGTVSTNTIDQMLAVLRQKLDDRQAELDKLMTQKTALESLAQEQDRWADAMQRWLQTISTEAEFGYQLFVDGPQRLSVVETTGWEW